ncbi:MAG: SAM-dependent methyltransferase [Thalassobius sp.]|nr:SAM-dependent methyltransferase [Thalassovita sp.]
MTYTTINAKQAEKMKRYYIFHSKIYDLTRWTFLFGRKRLVKNIPFQPTDHFRLLEVGCGTGYNLAKIHEQFPNAELTGIDVSEDMLNIAAKKTNKASKKVKLVCEAYGENTTVEAGFDVVMFSYSLSMINPFWKDLLEQALRDLKPGGYLAVTDFHDSKFNSFKKWMGVNHVKMDGHLFDWLDSHFQNHQSKVKKAYTGVWEYLIFIGKKEL